MPDAQRNTEAPKNSGTNQALGPLRQRLRRAIEPRRSRRNSADPATPEKGTLPAEAGALASFVAPHCERGTCLAHRGEHVQWEDCEQWTPSLQAGRLLVPEALAGDQLEPPAAAEGESRSERAQLRHGYEPSASDRCRHWTAEEGYCAQPEDAPCHARAELFREPTDWGDQAGRLGLEHEVRDIGPDCPCGGRMELHSLGGVAVRVECPLCGREPADLWERIPGPPPEMFVRTEHGDMPMDAWLAAHPERPEAFRMFRESFSDLRPLVIQGSALTIERLASTPLCPEVFEVPQELREAAHHPGRDHWCCRLSGHAGVHLCTCGMEWRPAVLPRPSAGDGLMAIRHSLALVEIAGLHKETRYAPPGWIGEPQRRCAEDHKPWPCPTSLLCQQAAQAPGIPGAGPEAALAKDPT